MEEIGRNRLKIVDDFFDHLLMLKRLSVFLCFKVHKNHSFLSTGTGKHGGVGCKSRREQATGKPRIGTEGTGRDWLAELEKAACLPRKLG